jgi:hypothetical protein
VGGRHRVKGYKILVAINIIFTLFPFRSLLIVFRFANRCLFEEWTLKLLFYYYFFKWITNARLFKHSVPPPRWSNSIASKPTYRAHAQARMHVNCTHLTKITIRRNSTIRIISVIGNTIYFRDTEWLLRLLRLVCSMTYKWPLSLIPVC